MVVFAVLLVVGWAAAPAARAVSLIANVSPRPAPVASRAGLPVSPVRFTATDGIALSGWFALTSSNAPTIILVHGSRGSRVDMLPWARFLYAAGYNVLLYDSRGCGQSQGWSIALGAREAADVLGAVRYLRSRPDLTLKRFGALGVSLGAGEVLLAAARAQALGAVVADSAWADQQVLIARMGTVSFGHFAVPVLPYGPALVDALIEARLADARPIAVIGQIAPRAVLLIHSADDHNTTTPLSGEQALFAAAGQPKAQWIAPSGGHVGALDAHPADYERVVLAFFAAHLGTP
jgi:pimeloyl-ACP methyl ester carboxylesterase